MASSSAAQHARRLTIPLPGAPGGGGRGRRLQTAFASRRLGYQPPHLLVLVLELPHLSLTQSATRSLEPSSCLDQASPGTSPGVFHTTSNWPSARTSPISTGLVM